MIGGHPRVGGGTSVTDASEPDVYGPSPRGRGHPKGRLLGWLSKGAIPAWAGAPRASMTLNPDQTGHPRVGGGT